VADARAPAAAPPAPPPGAVALRPERADDAPFVFQLFAQTRAAMFAGLPLGAAQLDALLRQQFQLQTTQYRHGFPQAERSILEVEAQPIGRFYVDWSTPVVRVIDVTLLAEWRGQGRGGDLLRRLLEETAAAGRTVGLHVERDNPARRLYRRLGFRVIHDKDIYLEMEWRPDAPEERRPGRDDRAA